MLLISRDINQNLEAVTGNANYIQYNYSVKPNCRRVFEDNCGIIMFN